MRLERAVGGGMISIWGGAAGAIVLTIVGQSLSFIGTAVGRRAAKREPSP